MKRNVEVYSCECGKKYDNSKAKFSKEGYSFCSVDCADNYDRVEVSEPKRMRCTNGAWLVYFPNGCQMYYGNNDLSNSFFSFTPAFQEKIIGMLVSKKNVQFVWDVIKARESKIK